MPDSENGIHRIVPDKGDSPQRRREKIIVLATILLVVIGVMTLMRRGSNAQPSTDSSGSDYSGGPDASGAGGGSYGAQLPGEIGSIPEQTAALLNTGLANQLANTRAKLANARRTRQSAHNRAQRESKTIQRERRTIGRQHAEIARLEKHHGHTGKKNGEHRAPAPHQPKPKAMTVTKSQVTPFAGLRKIGAR